MDPIRNEDALSADWVLATLLVVLALLAWINVSSPRKWRSLVKALFQQRLGRQLMSEEMNTQDRTLLGLLLGALGSMALFFYQALWSEGLLEAGLGHYVRVLSICACIMVFQILLARFTTSVAGADGGLGEFVHTSLLMYILLGLLLLPVVLLIAYQGDWRPELMLVGVALSVLLLLYRWVRGLLIGMGEGVRLRYIILYLCAFEFVPALLALHQLRSGMASVSDI